MFIRVGKTETDGLESRNFSPLHFYFDYLNLSYKTIPIPRPA